MTHGAETFTFTSLAKKKLAAAQTHTRNRKTNTWVRSIERF